jgi:hypothetical protein
MFWYEWIVVAVMCLVGFAFIVAVVLGIAERRRDDRRSKTPDVHDHLPR